MGRAFLPRPIGSCTGVQLRGQGADEFQEGHCVPLPGDGVDRGVTQGWSLASGEGKLRAQKQMDRG